MVPLLEVRIGMNEQDERDGNPDYRHGIPTTRAAATSSASGRRESIECREKYSRFRINQSF